MKRLSVIVAVMLLTLLMLSPAQAKQKAGTRIDVAIENVASPCNCEKDADLKTVSDLPQGETELVAPPPADDHTWGGDPDNYWVNYWWFVMNCVVFPSDCNGSYNIIY